MTYEELFGRCLSGQDGIFAAVWSRPADCKPDQPELPADRDRRLNLEYRVKVYWTGRKTHLMDRLALAIGYRFRVPYRYIEYRVQFEGEFRRTKEEAYSSAIGELMFPKRRPSLFRWSSPEECELKMEAAELL